MTGCSNFRGAGSSAGIAHPRQPASGMIILVVEWAAQLQLLPRFRFSAICAAEAAPKTLIRRHFRSPGIWQATI
jgi:hypothetical protein